MGMKSLLGYEALAASVNTKRPQHESKAGSLFWGMCNRQYLISLCFPRSLGGRCVWKHLNAIWWICGMCYTWVGKKYTTLHSLCIVWLLQMRNNKYSYIKNISSWLCIDTLLSRLTFPKACWQSPSLSGGETSHKCFCPKLDHLAASEPHWNARNVLRKYIALPKFKHHCNRGEGPINSNASLEDVRPKMTWRVSLTAPGADQQVHFRASKDAPAAEALQPAVAASRRVAWSKGFGTFGRGAVDRHQLMKHIVCAMLEQHHIVWSVARIAASAPAISSSLCGIARLCIF